MALTYADIKKWGLARLSDVAGGISGVTSFNTRTGAVTAVTADLSDSSAAGRTLVTAADAAAQRTALGLGTAATTASSAYATAAQGTAAISALQPGTQLTQSAVTNATAAGVTLLDAANATAQKAALAITQVDITANAPVPIDNTTTLTSVSHANRQLIYSGTTATLTISADGTGGWANDDSIEIHTLAASAGAPTLATPDGKTITGSATKIIGAVRKGSGLWTTGTTDPAAPAASMAIDMFAANSLLLMPTGKNVTSWIGIGHGPNPAAVGTATARNSSLASLGYINRIGYVSAAVAGSNSYVASASTAEISIAPSTSAQFPTQYVRVMCAVTDALTACRTGFGFFSATPANVEASALPNCAIFGADSTDSNLSLIVNDGTTTTKTALNGGTGFPCNTNGADIYEGYLAFAGGATRTLSYYITNRATGVKVSGSVTANLPAAGTALRVGAYRNNAANATACSIDVGVIASGGFAQMGATS